MKWMMPDFQMDPVTIDENYRSHASSQGEDQLDSLPAHAAQSLYVGVVRDPRRVPEPFSQRGCQIETIPAFAHIGSGVNDAIFNHARKPRRDPRKLRALTGELPDGGNHVAGRRAFRSRNSYAFVDRFAVGRQRPRFDSGAANIDRQSEDLVLVLL